MYVLRTQSYVFLFSVSSHTKMPAPADPTPEYLQIYIPLTILQLHRYGSVLCKYGVRSTDTPYTSTDTLPLVNYKSTTSLLPLNLFPKHIPSGSSRTPALPICQRKLPALVLWPSSDAARVPRAIALLAAGGSNTADMPTSFIRPDTEASEQYQ